MIEVQRRIVLLIGLLVGIALTLGMSPPLVRVRAVDWEREKERHPYSSQAAGSDAAYIADQTKGRLVEVSGDGWRAFAGEVQAALRDGSGAAKWSDHRGTGYQDDALYFRVDEGPLAEVAARLTAEKPFTYVAVATGARALYFTANLQQPRDYLGYAPAGLARPFARAGGAALLLALALYVFLPWRRRPANAMYYGRFRGAILPDFLATVLTAMFFSLPFLIVASNGSTGSVFEPGWFALTVIMWAFAAACVTIYGYAAHYATFCIEILPDALRVTSLRGERIVPFSEVERVGPITWRPARWMVVLGVIASLLNWRAAGPSIILSTTRHHGFEIVERGGGRLRVWLTGLVHGELVAEALDAHGIPFDGGVRQPPAGQVG